MKFLFAADMSFNYMPEFPGIDAVNTAMSEVKGYFEEADFSIVNLENVLGIREEYTPIFKCGPNLMTTDNFINYIKALNPSVVGLSNNHTGDYGEEAIYHTLDVLDENQFPYIGAGANIEEAYKPYIAEKDGIKVGIIAVCENEFGGAKENKAGSSVYKLTRLKNELNKLKEENIKSVVFFHGGNERNPFPSPGKKELYRHFIDMGASAVIAMHTHCPQGYEIYNNAPIIYSMGNFFFPQEPAEGKEILPTWNYGYLTELDFKENETKIKIIPYKFDFDKIYILKGEELDQFTEYVNYLSEVILDDKKLNEFFDAWCIKVCRFGRSSLEFNENMIEEGNQNVAIARNKFTCEAHNELWENYYVLCYEKRHHDAEYLIEEIEALQKLKLKK